MLDHNKKAKNRTANINPKISENPQVDDARNLTTNPGDRIIWSQTIEEKSKQLAVAAPDITGDYIKVPTYFIVDYPNGERKALHHVKDAKAISDVIRQAQYQQENWDQPLGTVKHSSNVFGIILMLALFLMSVPILIGIF